MELIGDVDESAGNPAHLYERWEQQHWSVGDIPVAEDLPVWEQLGPFTRGELQDALVELAVGEAAVARTLAPLVYAAPTEEAQLYLSTQLVDEARHERFMFTYLEAMGVTGRGLDAQIAACEARSTEEVRRLFGERLVGRVEAVRVDPGDRAAWYRAVVLYHILIEGVLALTVLRSVADMASRLAPLPQLAHGLTNVLRDESRHVGFGVWALRQAPGDGCDDAVEDELLDSLPAVVDVLVSPSRERPVPILPQARELRAAQLVAQWERGATSLSKRLSRGGLQALLPAVTQCWQAAQERALAAYAARHGAPHPAGAAGSRMSAAVDEERGRP